MIADNLIITTMLLGISRFDLIVPDINVFVELFAANISSLYDFKRGIIYRKLRNAYFQRVFKENSF